MMSIQLGSNRTYRSKLFDVYFTARILKFQTPPFCRYRRYLATQNRRVG